MLALALEPGMDRGCHALPSGPCTSSFAEPTRSPGPSADGGKPPMAPEGCSVSVILVNVLTTI